MTTCFLFVKHLLEEPCQSLLLNDAGEVIQPLASRSIAEIKILQEDARTIVVLTAEKVGLHFIELPKLAESKARAAIPFALEEQLAQPISHMHFAYDASWYEQGAYLVVAMDKAYLEALTTTFKKAGVRFEFLTIDWFALHKNEACIKDSSILIHDTHFIGSLSFELAQRYLHSSIGSTTLLSFKDSNPDWVVSSCTSLECPVNEWVAMRLLKMPYMNICQGVFTQEKRSAYHWYYLAMGLLGTWFGVLLLSNMMQLAWVHYKTTRIDKEIASVYREFFPESKQVISPKFRIMQQLQGHNASEGNFWILLDKLSTAFNGQEQTIDQIRFQNKTLSITLKSKDFAALEQLQRILEQSHVKVTQTQASSHEGQVLATLELSI